MVPTTAWDETARLPWDIPVQLEPRLPLARAKLSDAEVAVEALPPVPPEPVQVMVTVVTLAAMTDPAPLVTVQVCPEGLVGTVT